MNETVNALVSELKIEGVSMSIQGETVIFSPPPSVKLQFAVARLSKREKNILKEMVKGQSA